MQIKEVAGTVAGSKPNASEAGNCFAQDAFMIMLLSHKYQFIFIKTRKTAGTSIEVDLAPFLAPDDVVTPIRPPVPGHQPRNHGSINPLRRLLKRTYHNHASARIVLELAGREVFSTYFKFCVEREPVAKCISMWRMIAEDSSFAHYNPSLTWDEYVERGQFPVNDEMYLDSDGSLMVDRVLRYENLNQELMAVTAQLGIPFGGLKARAKCLPRIGPELMVTPAQRQQVYEAFAPTLRFTGYSDCDLALLQIPCLAEQRAGVSASALQSGSAQTAR